MRGLFSWVKPSGSEADTSASSPTEAVIEDSENAHIFEFIDDYISLPHPPNAAVLIDGAWGIGKSFAVNAYIAKLRREGKKVVYVSLYGLTTADDIDTALLTGTYAILHNKYARQGARIGKAALKAISFGADLKFADVLADMKIDLIVFDDIERALMPPTEVLGYINSFVEHDEMRVVIICNEAEVPDRDQYKRIREKVVGTTFQLQMRERPALASFIAKVAQPDARAFLEAHADEILAIFQQSETRNLRLLRQTIWAWSRLYPYIEPRFRNRTRGMVSALRLFTALSIELKAGRITCDDLRDRAMKIVAGRLNGKDGEGESTPLSRAQKRYQNLWLNNSVLNDEVLSQVLCEGRHDSEAINASLSLSEYFLTPDEEPAWQTVWHGLERDASDYDRAYATMEQQFIDRAFTKEGEILHVMSLRLWAAEIGHLSRTEADVVAEGKKYIDDLLESDQLAHGPTSFDRFTGAYGLGFINGNSPAFRELVSYYQDSCAEAFKRTWPRELSNLYSMMANDVDAFFGQVCRTNDANPNPFARVPIFSVSKPSEFVARMLDMHPSAQRTIFRAIDGRYEFSSLQSELADERDWLIGVREGLMRYANDTSTPPIRRFTIQNEVKRVIDPLLT